MKYNSILFLLLITIFHSPYISFTQNKEVLFIQKPASELSISPRSLGVNFKLSGDRSKLILLAGNQLEIWSTNSRRILFKKKLDPNERVNNFDVNYFGDIYALLKSNPKEKKHYIIELFRLEENKPFLILDSKTDPLIDAFTKVRFNKYGDKIAIIHKDRGIKIYQDRDGIFSVLKHLNIKNDIFIKIKDFEFSNDDKHFFLFKGNDLQLNQPITYQKWNLDSFDIDYEILSKNFGLNTSMARQLHSEIGHKTASANWNLEHGLVVNCRHMQTLSRSKRTGNIKPNDKSYLELYSVKDNNVTNLLSHDAIFNEAIIPDAETIITSDENRDIYVWDIKTGKHIINLKTDAIIKKEDLDIPFIKSLTRLAIMHVDPNKKEVYYTLSQQRVIRVWNYEYNTNDIFQSNLAKVSSPFFTSDSTVIYKKGSYLEHFDFKNQNVISLKKENKSFSFKYSKKRHTGITKTDNYLKLWNITPLQVLDSIRLSESPFTTYFIDDDLEYVALVPVNSFANAFSSLVKNPNKKANLDKLSAGIMKHIVNKTYKFNGSPVDKQEVKIKLFQIKKNFLDPIEEIKVSGVASTISFNTNKDKILISSFNLPVVGQTDNYTSHSNYIYDLKLKTLKALPKEINGISQMIPSTNNFFSRHHKNGTTEIKIIDFNTEKIEKRFTFSQKDKVGNGKFDLINSDIAILYGKKNNTLLNLNTGTSQLLNNSFDGFDISDNKKLLVTTNGGMFFYDTSLDNKLYEKYHHSDNKSSIIILPNNYYFNKEKGYELVSILKNNRAYNFEQFDLKYHRPDLVIESIKETLGDRIYKNKDLYNLAYKKRLQRIGKKEGDLKSDIHTPELAIVNRASLPNKTNSSSIKINIKAEDNIYNLKKLQITVNGVLIKSLDYDIKNKTQYNTTIPLVLSNGKNKILISVANEKGVFSEKEEINIEKVKNTTLPNLFVVSLGVSKYQYLKETPNSSKDAKTIEDIFIKTNSNPIKSLSLTDKEVTKNSLKQISTFLSEAKENDIIFFFVSGHAIQFNNEYFFCTSNSTQNNINTTGITYSDFDELLGKTKSRNRLLILNTCYSGEVFNAKTIKEIEAINLMRKVFEDLKITNGTTVISASEGTDKYYESSTKGNGMITLAILNLIKTKDAITVQEFCNEIIKYCSINNKKDPFGNKLNKNIPLVRYNNIYNDFKIWYK